MANPSSREELKQYCLRQLGAPVLEINVDDDQLEDRIDEALQLYQEYHFDGTEKFYLKHQVTQENITNEWIPVDNSITGIIRVFPYNSALSSTNMFDVRYQLRLNDIFDLSKQNLTGYTIAIQHLDLIENIFNQAPPFRFNRHMDKLYVDIKWSTEVTVGEYLLVEAYKIVDPESYTQVYNDMWLKKYTTQLFKKQWGSNLIKFDGMQLPGGITLNGRQLYDDALGELQAMDEELQLKYQLPDDFMTG